MEWDTNKAWRRQVERRLYELTSLVKGNMPAQADRIADIVEQVDELRQELKRQDEFQRQVSDKLDKVAEYVKANVPKKSSNGGE